MYICIAGAKEIDIAATLEHIRDQRMNMVKTKVRYLCTDVLDFFLSFSTVQNTVQTSSVNSFGSKKQSQDKGN